MNIDVHGDGIYLALIDPSRYESFVGADWDERDGLLEPHFVSQMSRGAALIWGTGVEADWRVEVREGITSQPGFREVVGGIAVSNEGLYLCNYDSLSMAAQFSDHHLPDADCAENKIDLKPGNYEVRVVQISDPESIESTDSFVIEFRAVHTLPPAWASVPWSIL